MDGTEIEVLYDQSHAVAPTFPLIGQSATVPLPTNDVILRYGAPVEFERNVVAYNEGQVLRLEKALVLGDAISDLPPVSNDESGEEISYRKPPENEFQKFIRATRSG
ncbi:MAD2L1-binding protein [Dionaea muscipula]